MGHPKQTSGKSKNLSRRQRVRAIRDAVERHRATTPPPPETPPIPLSPITVGSTVSFYDARGRFVTGTVLDDESFRVSRSNSVPTSTVVYKSPYMSWEESLRVVGKSTLIKPRDLIGFTKMLVDDVDLDEIESQADLKEPESDDEAYRQGA